MLRNIELEVIKIGHKCNANKTEMMPFNHDNVVDIKSKDENKIKSVDNFKYPGGWINIPEKKFEIRNARAWPVGCQVYAEILKELRNWFWVVNVFFNTGLSKSAFST